MLYTCNNYYHKYCIINKTELRPNGNGYDLQCPICDFVYHRDIKEPKLEEPKKRWLGFHSQSIQGRVP